MNCFRLRAKVQFAPQSKVQLVQQPKVQFAQQSKVQFVQQSEVQLRGNQKFSLRDNQKFSMYGKRDYNNNNGRRQGGKGVNNSGPSNNTITARVQAKSGQMSRKMEAVETIIGAIIVEHGFQFIVK